MVQKRAPGREVIFRTLWKRFVAWKEHFPGRKVRIHSGSVEPGDLFWALPGSRHHGIEFVEDAIQRGAVLVITDQQPGGSSLTWDVEIQEVPDSLYALHTLSLLWREKGVPHVPILAITGSVGKTSLSSLVQQLLATTFKVAGTPQSWNNHIGVPVSLLNLSPETEIAVFEIGTNQPGDIAFLCNLLQPHEGIITCIAESHLERLHDRWGVLKEKTMLYAWLRKQPHSRVYVNREDPVLMRVSQGLRRIEYGRGTGYEVHLLSDGCFPVYGIQCQDMEFSVRLQTPGNFWGKTIESAVAIAHTRGVSPIHIREVLESWLPPGPRARLLTDPRTGARIWLDAYNASPVSMRASLNAFRLCLAEEVRNTPHLRFHILLILGGMKELGKFSKPEHHRLLTWLETTIFPSWKEHDVWLWLVGEEFGEWKGRYASPRWQWFAHTDQLREAWEALIQTGKIGSFTRVFLKGSRQYQLESILDGTFRESPLVHRGESKAKTKIR